MEFQPEERSCFETLVSVFFGGAVLVTVLIALL